MKNKMIKQEWRSIMMKEKKLISKKIGKRRIWKLK